MYKYIYLFIHIYIYIYIYIYTYTYTCLHHGIKPRKGVLRVLAQVLSTRPLHRDPRV